MSVEYNVYCDESCHLENDSINAMTLGAVWVPKSDVAVINQRIRSIKERNNFNVKSEAKWTKVCPKRKQLYLDLVNYFFDNDDLKFRCLLVPDKSILRHDEFRQTHDDWYYKMYFNMLKLIFDRENKFNVYIDIKDDHSYSKAQKLREVCCNSLYDFTGQNIKKIQPIRSNEVEIMQIVDILIGAIAYEHRHFDDNHVKSTTKLEIIDLIKKRAGLTLRKSSMLRELDFNLFVWHPGGL